MHALYTVSVILHVVAACAWIGGMIFFAAVVVPVVRRPEFAQVRTDLVKRAGARFRALGWISLGTLLVTGTTNLAFRGVGLAALGSAAFWRSDFGDTLAHKLVFVALVLASTVLHDVFALGSRRVSAMLGRATLVFSAVVVMYAVWLVRGAP